MRVLFIKPVQTGFPEDCDARLVAAAGNGRAFLGPHAAEAMSLAGGPERQADVELPAVGGEAVAAHTLFAWRQAVGPHLAVETEGVRAQLCSILTASSTP